MRSQRTHNRAQLGLALAPGTAFLVFFVWRASANPYGPRRFTLFDDAMISMTYARTLADTGELVWFPGADRVQGFTNPLWTLYLAVVHRLGLEGSSAALAVSLTGVVLVLASACLVSVLVRRGLGDNPYALPISSVAASITPFLYPFSFWTLRGMEVGVLSFLLLAMIAAMPLDEAKASAPARIPGAAALIAALGVFTRIDFAVLAVAVFGCALWWTNCAERKRFALTGGGVIVSSVVSVLLVERLYWGEWLPNTYRVKVEGVAVAERLQRGLFSVGKVVPLSMFIGLALLIVFSSGSDSAKRLSTTCASAFVAVCAYTVWVGGDVWEAYLLISRYISVALPAAVVVVFISAGWLLDPMQGQPKDRRLALLLLPITALGCGLVSNPYRFHRAYAAAMCVAVALAVAGVLLTLRLHRSRTNMTSAVVVTLAIATAVAGATGAYPSARWVTTGGLHIADDQTKTAEGLALNSATSPDAVIATSWAGAPGYYSSRSMIDLLGKSDPVIAEVPPRGDFLPGHNKWDYDYSIGTLRPDIAFTTWAPNSPVRQRLADWGYVPRCMQLPDGSFVEAHFLRQSPHINWDTLHECDTAS